MLRIMIEVEEVMRLTKMEVGVICLPHMEVKIHTRVVGGVSLRLGLKKKKKDIRL